MSVNAKSPLNPNVAATLPEDKPVIQRLDGSRNKAKWRVKTKHFKPAFIHISLQNIYWNMRKQLNTYKLYKVTVNTSKLKKRERDTCSHKWIKHNVIWFYSSMVCHDKGQAGIHACVSNKMSPFYTIWLNKIPLSICNLQKTKRERVATGMPYYAYQALLKILFIHSLHCTRRFQKIKYSVNCPTTHLLTIGKIKAVF